MRAVARGARAVDAFGQCRFADPLHVTEQLRIAEWLLDRMRTSKVRSFRSSFQNDAAAGDIAACASRLAAGFASLLGTVVLRPVDDLRD